MWYECGRSVEITTGCKKWDHLSLLKREKGRAKNVHSPVYTPYLEIIYAASVLFISSLRKGKHDYFSSLCMILCFDNCQNLHEVLKFCLVPWGKHEASHDKHIHSTDFLLMNYINHPILHYCVANVCILCLQLLVTTTITISKPNLLS